MAIIDILTHYDAKKKAAHAAKTVKHGVSCQAHRNNQSDGHGRLEGRIRPEPEPSVCLLIWRDSLSFHISILLWLKFSETHCRK